MSTLQVENLIGPTSGSNANKVIVPSGQTLYAAGHVIQVVGTTATGQTETSSQGFVNTASTATITPKFSTSKVLVLHSAGGLFRNHGTDWNTTGVSAIMQLSRNGTATSFSQSRWAYSSVGQFIGINWSFSYLDSPSSTSALTYLVAIGKDNTVGTIGYNDNSGNVSGQPKLATLTLMEIAQ